MIYGKRSNGGEHGIVLTKPFVVSAMLDSVSYKAIYNLSRIRVLEPSAGDGAFAVEIVKRLFDSSVLHGFDFELALSNLVFYEIDEKMSIMLKNRLKESFPEQENLFSSVVQVEDFLLSGKGYFDLVVGNPPYVRYDNIPEQAKNVYRSAFATFRHRSDLYIAFYEKGLSLLNPGGTLSFICSNRWLKNQYGASLRELIRLKYDVKEVIDMENASPFEEEVLAYPAITTIQNTNGFCEGYYRKIEKIEDLVPQQGESVAMKRINSRSKYNWFTIEEDDYNDKSFLTSLEEQNFQIGIGVATGCDRIFIRKDFNLLVEEELLIPILSSKDLKYDIMKWSGNYILNPYRQDGSLIDLECFPKARKYFEANKEVLMKRHVAIKYPKSWYRTIDRVLHSILRSKKILLPDISGNSHLFMDMGEFYPHHNLYFISDSSERRLMILAAILESDFVKEQLLQVGTTMNGGYPRWQSQNLRKLRIPRVDSIVKNVADELVEAYKNRDKNRINEIVRKDKFKDYCNEIGQMIIFDSMVV